MRTIEVEGNKYRVTENLGYQGGYYAKAVDTPDGERIAVKRGGIWTWWTARDRVGQRSHVVGMSNDMLTVSGGRKETP
jgi:hypothetical protein